MDINARAPSLECRLYTLSRGKTWGNVRDGDFRGVIGLGEGIGNLAPKAYVPTSWSSISLAKAYMRSLILKSRPGRPILTRIGF